MRKQNRNKSHTSVLKRTEQNGPCRVSVTQRTRVPPNRVFSASNLGRNHAENFRKHKETQMSEQIRRKSHNIKQKSKLKSQGFSKRTGSAGPGGSRGKIGDSNGFLTPKLSSTRPGTSSAVDLHESERNRAESDGNGVVQRVDFTLGRKQKEASEGFRDPRTCDSTEAVENQPERWRDLPRSRTPRGARTRPA